MHKSVKVAMTAAASLFSASFLLAYGATTAANAQVQPFEFPMIKLPVLTGPVEADTVDLSADADDALAAADATETVSAPAPASLSELVANWKDTGEMDAETRCLATAIFFESRSESLDGQLAVANVILARAKSGRFPSTICGVITQRSQFGFVRNGRLPKVPTYKPAWRTAKAVARIALDQSWKNPAEGALYFHATYTSPNWGRPMVTQIGRHIFYK